MLIKMPLEVGLGKLQNEQIYSKCLSENKCFIPGYYEPFHINKKTSQ